MGKNLSQWIKRLRKGDQSAFLPLYEKTAPGLMRFLLWKTGGDRPLSEDILQEAYVRFLMYLDNIESDQDVAVQSYLLHIARNILIDKTARSPHSNRQHVSLDAIAAMPDPASWGSQERAVEMRELAVAMESLNEKDSEIIWLRDALGMSHREVASQVGITEQASRQAYVRAKRSLVSELKNKFMLGSAEQGGGYAIPELS
jgi:RNA polymerase sigma-70 factor, ECF subfamily